MEYLQWNSVIASYFFNPEKAGKEVLLYITKKEIARLGIKHLNFQTEEESWEDYCDVVSKGLRNSGRKKPLSDNIKLSIEEWSKYSKWIYEQNNSHPFEINCIPVTDPVTAIAYPFFMAFIPLLIIPLTQSNIGVRSNAYYGPLSDFLNNNNISTQKESTSSFAQIDAIWSQLEIWTKIYYKTDLGIFTERQFGNPNWRYVGKPFSQCVLTPRNIRDIPKMFWSANIAPFSFISDLQLERTIFRYGYMSAGFSQRVVDVFNDPGNPLKKIIIDIVRLEFTNWQGDVIEYDDDDKNDKPRSGWSYGTLLSAFNLTAKNETFHHFYHLFSKNDFPEDLILNDAPVIHMANGFSEKIIESFKQTLEWTDVENKWRATPSKSEILLYISGSYFGLPSDTYVETDKISLVSKMFLLCPIDKRKSIDDWGETFAPGSFKEIDYLCIPEGYCLYRFQNPTVEHQSEQLLKFKNEKKIELKGGIKITNREFMPIRLPSVWLSGTLGNEKLYLEYVLDQQKIYLYRNDAIPEEFFLPEAIKTGFFFTIKMESESLLGDDIPYRIIESSFSPLDIIEDNLAKRNCRGELCLPNETEFVRGSNAIYNNWLRQQSCSMEFIPVDYDTVAFQLSYEPYLLTNGNLILEYLTLKRNVNYEEFSTVMEALDASTLARDDKYHKTNPKYVKKQAINYYDFAGFLDYDYSLDKITINKPQILVVPSIKSVEAILIGGRTGKFVEAIITASAEYKINIRIIPQQRQIDQYFIPDTIKLIPAECPNSTQAWISLRKLADKLNIEFYILTKPYSTPQIVQFGLQDFSANLKEYKSYILENYAVNIKDFAWARKTFNTETLAFEKDISSTIDKNLSLQEYFLQYRYRYILWLDGTSYEVDRNWGRFLLLAELKKHVIFYSNEKKILAIPKLIELPRLIAESITLLSGSTPYFKKMDVDGKNQIFKLYVNVPKLFAENLFKKFNQNIQPNLHI
ncbi:hypothetical protein [Pedobacter panaciterrae]|uniref:hypothetical protein n=1 Tax=Pedobacter panaciterrae TaxID=363849 RepID=UPI0025983BB8|nr:hypothetical protein [uncultured Pedobacter sp.]